MKEEILHIALERFLKYGIREMSVQKLIEPLRISTKTLYKYYANKEELLEASLVLYHAQQLEKLQESAARSNSVHVLLDVWRMAIEQAFRVNSIFFSDLHYYYPGLESKIEASIAAKFSNELLKIIQNGVKEGDFNKEIVPQLILEGMFVLYTSIARGEQFKRYKASPADLLANTIVVLIRGFCTPEGIQKLEAYQQMDKGLKKTKISKAKVTAFAY